MSDVKFIQLNEVLKYNVSRYSPFYLLAKELNLKLLMRYKDKFFYGPPYDLAEILDTLAKKFKINTLLDLFSGTGALGIVALKNNADKVVCVDAEEKAMKANLQEYKEKASIITGDILKMKFNDFYDVVILDPPEELSLKMAKKFPELKTDLIIMWYGPMEEKRENEIEKFCKNGFKEILIIELYGLKTICCSNTEKGKKYLNFLRKNFL